MKYLQTLATVVILIACSEATNAGAAPGVNANDLLTRSQAAVRAKNTSHLALTMRLSVLGSQRVQLHFEGDLSQRPALARFVAQSQLPTQANGIQSLRITEIIVGNTIATGETGKAYKCGRVKSITQAYQGIIGTPQRGSATLLGTGAVGEVAVYRIRAVTTRTVQGATVHAPLVYSIARATLLPIRVTGTVNTQINGVPLREKIMASYSRYGQPVHVSLPAACAKRG